MTLPLLLAGPIIRRVEQNQVYIWLSTSRYVQIDAFFYSISNDTETQSIHYEPLRIQVSSDMIQSGKNLYTYLIKTTPFASVFPLDSLIGYNILFKNRYEQIDLGDLNLLNKQYPNNIVYGNLRYPTFIIPEKTDTNILYGSCQKPHGTDQSVMVTVDKVIEQKAVDIQERPNSLFLMGDQIYADDVADPMFYKLQHVAQEVIGEELQQLHTLDSRLNMKPFRTCIDQLNGRQIIMSNFAKFTSHQAKNHLIRYQEYAAKYLLTLSPALWENRDNHFPTFDELLHKDRYYVIYPAFKKRKRKKEIKHLKKRYEKELCEVEEFIPTLSAMRRVLANTPTYMIFDDHDITDDWNISPEWVDNVYHAKLGIHTITNGLSAYWLFQGWGNDPKGFKSFLPLFTSQFHYYVTNSIFPERWAKQLTKLPIWSFVAPTNPKSLFLDIRTMRDFDYRPKPLRVGSVYQEGKNSPELIGKDGWNVITRTLNRSKWAVGSPLIIISPTPFYGLGIIESFLKKFVYPLRAIGLPVRYALDFEAWKYNGRGFNRFIQHLFQWNPQPCIILSGDVHYANALRSTVYNQLKGKLTINQFTSSPIHNMSFSGIWGKSLKLIVALNSITRKRKTFIRSFDKGSNLSFGKLSVVKKKQIIWHEEINYLSTTSGKVMHTHNNVGLIKITDEMIQNKLIMNKRTSTYKKSFR
ncbi:hypothetical protein [Ornithinibacillus scapharcae]|uniref:hypothetical protein n=1 Tax=Ornithinibacillus scapharcae TaxID=1147159 RepID=UPI000225AD51|nr:hypothetical protein [Ornithinibacillus scapharcae]